jgi:cellulose synthase/poly-beta-1,6-N-acetylglucosamine synthase-like glycosyltransferase
MRTLAVVLFCVVYGAANLGLMVYGLNCYIMLYLSRLGWIHAEKALKARGLRAAGPGADPALPVVTTQIAVYNEMNVAERVLRAACAMRYPAGKHEIQVLDDSTDETVGVIDRVAAELIAQGHDIQIVRRTHRTGFKAGALEAGLNQARGELIAVFDADFVPPPDFLFSVIPFFLTNARLGFAQARWGHLNRSQSLLTLAQAIGIDGHFLVEQPARSGSGLFLNFNGTAGVWRRTAIVEGGGWSWDTLTEDLDLSYRVQFKGWEALYLPDVVVEAELPEDVNAFRSQQFRWAKGSIQTVIKLFPQLARAKVSRFKKVQAFLHMTGYMVHPLMLLLSVLALPVLSLTRDFKTGGVLYAVLALPLILSILAPSTMYSVGQYKASPNWRRRLLLMPLMMVVGVGLALSNSRAVLEAIIGRKSEFVRTPKRGGRELKAYRVKMPWVGVLEVLLGAYCAYTLSIYILASKFAVSPFIAIYAAGFLFIGLMTIAQSLFPVRQRA